MTSGGSSRASSIPCSDGKEGYGGESLPHSSKMVHLTRVRTSYQSYTNETAFDKHPLLVLLSPSTTKHDSCFGAAIAPPGWGERQGSVMVTKRSWVALVTGFEQDAGVDQLAGRRGAVY